MAHSIRILTPKTFPSDHAGEIIHVLRHQFDVPVTHEYHIFDLDRAFDAARGQHLSAALIRGMNNEIQREEEEKLVSYSGFDFNKSQNDSAEQDQPE